jgi:hypothetical protein
MKTKVRMNAEIMKKGGVHIKEKPRNKGEGYIKENYCLHGVSLTCACEDCDKEKER